MTELRVLIKEAADKCAAAWAENPNAKFAWTCHHEILCEALTEPAESRIKYILENKVESERVTRLNNFRPVRVALLPGVVKAGVDWDKARVDWDKARADWNKAQVDYDKAWADRNKARADYDKAGVDYDKAWADRNKARADYDKAGEDWVKAWTDYAAELTILHNTDWPDNTWNGKSIFKEE
jgi:hypothetical protein